jgi:hypothetical protein
MKKTQIQLRPVTQPLMTLIRWQVFISLSYDDNPSVGRLATLRFKC